MSRKYRNNAHCKAMSVRTHVHSLNQRRRYPCLHEELVARATEKIRGTAQNFEENDHKNGFLLG
jgi:hypothetical protein